MTEQSAYVNHSAIVYDTEIVKNAHLAYLIIPTTVKSCGTHIKTILDLGCGNGEYYRQIWIKNNKKNLEIYAIDLSETQINLCKIYDQKIGLTQVQYIIANVFSPLFLSKQFDIIILSLITPHAKNVN